MKCRGAWEYLVPQYRKPELATLIGCAFYHARTHARFTRLGSIVVPGRDVFLATPYDFYGNMDCISGIEPALRHLGLNLVRADFTIGGQFLGAKAQQQIDRSDLVIANISETRRGVTNPNVTMEAAYAEGRAIPVLYIRRDRTAQRIIANYQGLDRLEYYTYADLAWKLYCALGGSIPLT
jgi:hypothetical protein